MSAAVRPAGLSAIHSHPCSAREARSFLVNMAAHAAHLSRGRAFAVRSQEGFPSGPFVGAVVCWRSPVSTEVVVDGIPTGYVVVEAPGGRACVVITPDRWARIRARIESGKAAFAVGARDELVP